MCFDPVSEVSYLSIGRWEIGIAVANYPGCNTSKLIFSRFLAAQWSTRVTIACSLFVCVVLDALVVWPYAVGTDVQLTHQVADGLDWRLQEILWQVVSVHVVASPSGDEAGGSYVILVRGSWELGSGGVHVVNGDRGNETQEGDVIGESRETVMSVRWVHDDCANFRLDTAASTLVGSGVDFEIRGLGLTDAVSCCEHPVLGEERSSTGMAAPGRAASPQADLVLVGAHGRHVPANNVLVGSQGGLVSSMHKRHGAGYGQCGD